MEDDSILWQRFKEGDKIAFELLIRAYYIPLFEYGRKFTSDRDAVKDHVHDLFTKLWDRRAVIGPTDNIKPYLLKSLRNLIIKERQRTNVFSELDFRELTPTSFEEDVETRIISDEILNENRHHIHSVLNTLSPRQQEIIHLKFYQNLTNYQIANLLAISRPAVANLLYQTLKLFREKWQILFDLAFFIFITGCDSFN